MPYRDLPYYEQYEEFYKTVATSEIYSLYCRQVFHCDFSQENFSDYAQLQDLLSSSGIQPGMRVLDIGCGTGKMAEHIAQATGSVVHGFDYSQQAVNYARHHSRQRGAFSLFRVGAIDEITYPEQFFDVILSIDSLYYTKNMRRTCYRILKWLKPHGCFAAFYGQGHLEGIIKPPCETPLAVNLERNGVLYQVTDYTQAHYQFMQRKHRVAEQLQQRFYSAGLGWYLGYILQQSIPCDMEYKKFTQRYNRYFYRFQKNSHNTGSL